MTESLSLEDVYLIGANEHYSFAVGRMGDRWVGFARGDEIIFVFSQISDGTMLGIPDRALAVKQTCAVAHSYEDGYGGIDHWIIPESERGTLEDYPESNDEDDYDPEFDA